MCCICVRQTFFVIFYSNDMYTYIQLTGLYPKCTYFILQNSINDKMLLRWRKNFIVSGSNGSRSGMRQLGVQTTKPFSTSFSLEDWAVAVAFIVVEILLVTFKSKWLTEIVLNFPLYFTILLYSVDIMILNVG